MNFKLRLTTPLQRILCLACASSVIIILNLLINFKQPAPIIVDETSTGFSASRAFDVTREFVTQFPKRLFGSLEARQATGFLTEKLTAMGYEVQYAHFDGRIGGGQRAGRNVLALKQGETDEIIAVTAHHDTARPTVRGAAKNGAAVGVLMELADVFSREKTYRSLLFVFTDGGEWGSSGAKDLTLNYEKKDLIAAALTLDYIAPGDLAGFRLDTIGQLSGLTPPIIRKLAEDVVKEQTPSVSVESNGLLEKAFMISGSEQGPFLKAGIPAINLGSFSTDRKREKTIIHSPEDTIENLKIETIGKYGRVAEQIVRSLAGSPEIPRFTNTPLPASQICGLIFCLVVFMTFRHIKDSRKVLNLAQTGRETAAFFAAWLPFLVLFSGIKLAYAARQFPFYDLYPAIAEDPVMQHPPLKTFALIAAGTAFAAMTVWIIAGYFLKEWVKPDYCNSCAVLWIILTITVLSAGFYNPFWMMVFLTLPLVLWPMPQPGKSVRTDAGKRIFDTVCILAAAVPVCIAFLWLTSRLGFGWNFFWYQTLALTTGLFSPIAYFIGTAVIAAGCRFIVISNRTE